MAVSEARSNPEREVLRMEEVADILDIGRTACYEAARQGQIPTIRLGRKLRVPRAALERLLRDGAAGPGAEGP